MDGSAPSREGGLLRYTAVSLLVISACSLVFRFHRVLLFDAWRHTI